MAIVRRFRFSMAAVMMLVVAAAAGSALFARVHAILKTSGDGWEIHIPSVLVLAITLTAIPIAAIRRHTPAQALLQATLAFLLILSLIYVAENAKTSPWAAKALIYWLQACFLFTVVLPLLAMRWGRPDDTDSPRAIWWRRTWEAVMASSGNLFLVFVGIWLQYNVAMYLGAFL